MLVISRISLLGTFDLPSFEVLTTEETLAGFDTLNESLTRVLIIFHSFMQTRMWKKTEGHSCEGV
jgi:hypothetical protein